ncbi:HMG box domain-containing protein [Entamoeba marina]
MSAPQQKVGEEDVRKRRKITAKEKMEKREEDLFSLAKGIYIKWKGREIMREDPNIIKKNAEEEAERRWETETDEVTQLYQKTAVIENKTEGVKRKEDWHPYLLFCKEHREELKVEGHNGNELMSMLSTKWKDLSDGEKLRYSEIAKENKRRDLGDDAEKIKNEH